MLNQIKILYLPISERVFFKFHHIIPVKLFYLYLINKYQLGGLSKNNICLLIKRMMAMKKMNRII